MNVSEHPMVPDPPPFHLLKLYTMLIFPFGRVAQSWLSDRLEQCIGPLVLAGSSKAGVGIIKTE